MDDTKSNINNLLQKYKDNYDNIVNIVYKDYVNCSILTSIKNKLYVGLKTYDSIKMKLQTHKLGMIKDIARSEFRVKWNKNIDQWLLTKRARRISNHWYKYQIEYKDLSIEIQIMSDTIIKNHQLYDLKKIRDYTQDNDFIKKLKNKINKKCDSNIKSFKTTILYYIKYELNLSDLLILIDIYNDANMDANRRIKLSECANVIKILNKGLILTRELASIIIDSLNSSLPNDKKPSFESFPKEIINIQSYKHEINDLIKVDPNVDDFVYLRLHETINDNPIIMKHSIFNILK